MAQILKKFTRADNIAFDSSGTSSSFTNLQEAVTQSLNNSLTQYNNESITATQGQTTFTPSTAYVAGFIEVYLDGVLLQNNVDYTAENGTTVVLTQPVNADQVVTVISYTLNVQEFGQSQADARYVRNTGDTINGNLDVTGTITGDVSFDNSSTLITATLVREAIIEVAQKLKMKKETFLVSGSPQSTFTVSEEPDATTVLISVDGVLIEDIDFTVNSTTITFDEPVDIDQTVKIVYQSKLF